MISVIVPIYRVEAYMDRCIRSILDQTYRDFELILVDDESPDRCGAMCDEWAARDARVRVFHPPHGGLSEARNTGIAHARGEYLCFVDSDDWVEPDMLESMERLLRDTDADLGCCNYVRVGESGERLREPGRFPEGVYTPDEFWELFYSFRTERLYYIFTWNKIYRRELFDKLRFTPGKINQDLYILYDLISACGTIALSSKVVYHYLQRSTSISRSSRSLKYLAAPEAYLNQAERFAEKKQWYYAQSALDIAIRNLLLRDYGEGGKKSPEYRALKRRARTVCLTVGRHLSNPKKLRFFLFFTCPPLARAWERRMERRQHSKS